jgi:hypothetical protein
LVTGLIEKGIDVIGCTLVELGFEIADLGLFEEEHGFEGLDFSIDGWMMGLRLGMVRFFIVDEVINLLDEILRWKRGFSKNLFDILEELDVLETLMVFLLEVLSELIDLLLELGEVLLEMFGIW